MTRLKFAVAFLLALVLVGMLGATQLGHGPEPISAPDWGGRPN
jgi:hypothetical protein